MHFQEFSRLFGELVLRANVCDSEKQRPRNLATTRLGLYMTCVVTVGICASLSNGAWCQESTAVVALGCKLDSSKC